MLWIIFSLLIAVIESAKDLLGRSTTQKIDPFVSAFALQFFAFLFITPIILITGIPEIKPVFYLASIYTLFSMPVWSILYMKGLTLSPLYISVPMLAFSPVFNALVASFFDKRILTLPEWLGIIFVGTGLYLIRVKGGMGKKGIFYPILNIKNERGALCMLGVSLIWGIGAHVAKIQTQASSPLFFAFTVTGVGTAILFIIGLFNKKLQRKTLFNNFNKLGTLGILNGAAEFIRGTALQIGYTPFVAAVSRLSIVISSLVGSRIYHDKMNRINVAGLLICFAGIVLIVVIK